MKLLGKHIEMGQRHRMGFIEDTILTVRLVDKFPDIDDRRFRLNHENGANAGAVWENYLDPKWVEEYDAANPS